MDPDVERECELDPLKYPKRHPGLQQLKLPRLPKLVEENALTLLQGRE